MDDGSDNGRLGMAFVNGVINMFGLAATTGGDDGNIDGIGNHGSYYKFITVFGAVGIY